MLSKLRVFIILVLVGFTWQLLQSVTGVTAVPIKKSLSGFPHEFKGYNLARSFQSSAEVLELLGVDDYIQYNYLDDKENRINLYAGYYKAVGVTGTYHSPKNCLPGGGWGIDSVKRVTLDTQINGKKNVQVAQMLIRNGDTYQVVLYWYQNRGRIIPSEYWEKIYLVWDAILMGRRDGTFVRIMTLAHDGDIAAAEQRAVEFAESVVPILADYLPGAEI